jgi:hypothetical protein
MHDMRHGGLEPNNKAQEGESEGSIDSRSQLESQVQGATVEP